jgi:hypothetical protein
MAKTNSDNTFAGYAAIMLLGGLVAAPELGLIGLFAAGVAIYTGACFMRGYTSAPKAKARKRHGNHNA